GDLWRIRIVPPTEPSSGADWATSSKLAKIFIRTRSKTWPGGFGHGISKRGQSRSDARSFRRPHKPSRSKHQIASCPQLSNECSKSGKPNGVSGAAKERLDIYIYRSIAEGGGPSGAIVTDPPLGSSDAPAGGESGIAASVAGGLPGSTTTRVTDFHARVQIGDILVREPDAA